MPPTQLPVVSYNFDRYTFVCERQELTVDERPVKLDHLTAKVLHVLLKASGRTVTIDDFIREVWGGHPAITEGRIRFHVHRIRREFGDTGRDGRFVETVHGEGYRFRAPVRMVTASGTNGEYYEKARYLFQKSTAPDLFKAIAFFEHIVAAGGAYVADAYAGIAEAYVLLGTFAHQSMPGTEAMTRARDAAFKAIAFGPHVAEAHSALASIAALHDWDWPAAQRRFLHALRLPSNTLVKPTVRAWYSICLAAKGEATEARRQADIAKAENPSSALLLALSARVAYLAGDPDRAIAEADDSILLERGLYLSHMFRGHALRLAGDHEGALASFRLSSLFSDRNPVAEAEVGHLLGQRGDRRGAQRILRRLMTSARRRYVCPHLMSHVCLGIGDHDAAMDYLEEAYQRRAAYMIFLERDPVYDPLRLMSRFRALVARVSF